MAQRVRAYVDYARFLDIPKTEADRRRALGVRAKCPLVQRYLDGGAWAYPEERETCEAYFVGLCKLGGQRQLDCAFDDVVLDLAALRRGQQGKGRRS